ncbi:hypothetical protein [Streptomyces resistomycificus]|uniref:hypothetical protein n=1 Tax=Streptomyces resistomycificus TaxID=67356 RepID=UPI000AC67ADC|nr:hypothetical protein [Streptomyces resistomycificus]
MFLVVARLADPPAVLEPPLVAGPRPARKGPPAEHVGDTEPYDTPLLKSLR